MQVLPEALRFLGDWRLVVYGIILLIVILRFPGGCIRISRSSWITESKTGWENDGKGVRSMAILELKDVTKKFGGLTAVDGVNLKIEENQISALIGPNGAGKDDGVQYDYRSLSGDKRRRSVYGESLKGKKPHQIVEKGIARTFQNIRL